MEIKTNLKKDFFKYFNESLGVAINRKKILKKHKLNKFNYCEQILLILCFIIFISIILLLSDYFIASLVLFSLSIFTLILNIINYIIRIKYEKSINYENTLIINENGITDNYLDIIITFTWPRIKALVIKENTLTILTDTYIYFYFSKKEKTKVKEAINKYQKDLLIIEM